MFFHTISIGFGGIFAFLSFTMSLNVKENYESLNYVMYKRIGIRKDNGRKKYIAKN